eukprot:g16980.t1
MGCGFADPRDLRQQSSDLSEIFLGAQRHLHLLRKAMNLALPDATVKMKLLTSLSDEEQQSFQMLYGLIAVAGRLSNDPRKEHEVLSVPVL